MSKTVLHELLAVEQGLAETANRVTKETTKTLSEKRSIFSGLTKAHEIFAEDQQHLKQATENVEVQTTVDEQIDYLSVELARYWDVTLQKEIANQKANADIVVDGITLVANIPSIVLLGMEKKLTALIAVYNAIPTLDAARAWEIDPNYAKSGVFRTKWATERQQTITEKVYKTVAPATERHPAQVVRDDETSVIGKYIQIDFSGAVTSLEKAERIQRLTKLIRAVKAARQRANNAEVDSTAVFGTALLNYVNGK